jgi:hypothetical protein
MAKGQQQINNKICLVYYYYYFNKYNIWVIKIRLYLLASKMTKYEYKCVIRLGF